MQASAKYLPSEVYLHSTKKDCWLIIHGKIYDVTTFLEDHPGGEDVLLQASAASEDATQSFEEVGHSSTAISMMESYLIGVVDTSEGRAKPSLLQKKRNPLPPPPTSSSFIDYLLPVLVLCLSFSAWYYLTYCQTKA